MEAKKKYNQQLYDIAILIIVFKNLLEPTELWRRPEIVDAMLILAFGGFIVLKLMNQHYKKWQLVLLFTLMVLCTYSCWKMNYFYLFFTIFCIAGMQDVDLKITVSKSAKLKLGFLAVHAMIYIIMRIISPGSVSYSYRVGGSPRYTFFMSHSNTFSMYLLWAIIEFCFAYYEALEVWQLLLGYGIMLLTHVFTDSNTLLIVGTIVMIMLVADKLTKKEENIIVRLGAKWLFPAMSLLFMITSVSYTRLSGKMLELYNTFDSALTGRLLYGSCAYDLKGFSIIGKQLFFPKKLYWRGHWIDGMIFDNSYIWMFVSYGVVFMILISVGFMAINKRLSSIEALMIMAYCLYGVMESYILNSALCFPILLIGKYIFEEKEGTKYTNKYLRAREKQKNLKGSSSNES